jgi:tripartite ATP-independent transporter DctP family solute receptor
MEENMLRKFLSPLVVIATMISAGVSTAQAATELSFGHCTATDDPYHIGAARFADLVGQYTSGSVKVNLFPGCQLGGTDRELIEGIKLGLLDISITASAPIASFEPKFMLFDLPFLFRDNAHAHAVLDGPIGTGVAKSLEPQGIKLISWMESGFRNMITINKKINSPDDMQNMKFRVMENPVYVSMFKNLGSSGVPISARELYTSLQTGVVDGYEHPVGAYFSIKAYEVAKLVALTGHSYTPAPVMMNLQKFQNLKPAEQEGVLRAGREAAAFQRAYVAKMLAEYETALRGHGVQFYSVDKAAFQRKMAPVYKEFESKVGKSLIDAVLTAQVN